MEQNKGLGGSLIDVFDAAVNLVKTEAGVLTKRATSIVKAKGIGVVLLLAATGPLLLGLIFIILALFYGLMRLGLGAWAAALFIALASFGLTGLLVVIGLGRLSANPKPDENADDYDLKTPFTEQESELRGDPELVGGRARVPQGQQVGAVQQVYLHGGAKVEGVKGGEGPKGRDLGDNKGIVPSTPRPGINAGEGQAAPVSSAKGAEDAGPQTHDKKEEKLPGITVSTEPTYKDDMKKEGY